MDDGLPRWVNDELHNWSRFCWMGEWPHPKPLMDCASAERAYRSPDWEGDPSPYIPVNVDRARRVQAIHDSLPLPEQRVMQAEFPRRHEYGDMRQHQRITSASLKIGITEAYYRIALCNIKQEVFKEFR